MGSADCIAVLKIRPFFRWLNINFCACVYLLSFENRKCIDRSVWMYTELCSLVSQLLFILDLFYIAVVKFSTALWSFFASFYFLNFKLCRRLTVPKGLHKAWASGCTPQFRLWPACTRFMSLHYLSARCCKGSRKNNSLRLEIICCKVYVYTSNIDLQTDAEML